ncbi:DapH/DapD/GlmU-related protein, partial [Aeromonas hydrophila]
GEGVALPISIGDGCWIGADVLIIGGVTIGKGVVVAAGSVVTRDIPDNVLVAGVPAVIKRRLA